MAIRRNRNVGIEIFRCFLMMLIVLHHACMFGSLSSTPAAWTLYPLTVIGVDAFVVISGWYGIDFTWTRFLRVWGVVVFYQLVSFLVGGQFVHWWFASAYLCLMMLSPLLNTAIKGLAVQRKAFLQAWVLYALAVLFSTKYFAVFSQMQSVGWTSHCVNTLVFVYVTSAMIHALFDEKIKTIRWGRWFFLSAMLLVALSLAGFHAIEWIKGIAAPCRVFGGRFAFGYDSPLIWGTAIIAFLCFKNISIQKWGGASLCVFLAPSMFGVYLFHESALGRKLYQMPMAWITENWQWMPDAGNILLCTILTFTISLCVDLLRRGGLHLIKCVWNMMWLAFSRKQSANGTVCT